MRRRRHPDRLDSPTGGLPGTSIRVISPWARLVSAGRFTLKPRSTLTEVAPRAFEVALHYASAISAGAFGQVVDHDRAVGVPVRTTAGSELPEAARHALAELASKSVTVLNARARAATLRCPTPARERIETYAILDAAVASDGWFIAARLTWPLDDFRDGDCPRRHDRIVLAVEDDGQDEMGLFRLSFDDIEGAALRVAVRDSLLQTLVLRPAFGAGDASRFTAEISSSIPRSGDHGSTPTP